jgi:hypothetical protein
LTPTFEYKTFDLSITPDEGSSYVARVVHSPVGEAREVIDLGEARSVARAEGASGPYTEESALAIGAALYDGAFRGEVEVAFERSRDRAAALGMGLRTRLRLNEAPELASLPWEYAYRSDKRRWVFLSNETPLVRYLEVSDPVEPLAVDAPLRILVMVSNPSDQEALDIAAEWSRIEEATAELSGRGAIVLDRLEPPTYNALQVALRSGTEFHILHFVGHGLYEPGAPDGALIFENDAGGSHAVTGQQLSTLLADHHALRMAVLNACDAGATSDVESFTGVTQMLVAHGLPAVIAMQCPISDSAAVAFAQEFYGPLTERLPVDAALAEARKALSVRGGPIVEWGTPVLYLRAEDGAVFDISGSEDRPAERGGFEPRGLDEADWDRLMRRLERGRVTPLIGWGASLPAIPDKQAIADAWADEHGYPLQGTADLTRVAQYLAVTRDRLLPKDTMQSLLDSVTLDAFEGQANAYTALAELPVSVYLTTNFDDLLLDALKRAGKNPVREICPWRHPPRDAGPSEPDPAVEQPTVESPVVYHLHGHPEDLSSIVLTEDDFFDFVVSVSRNPRIIRPRILEALTGTSLMMVGYRLEDWMFRVLVRGVVTASDANARGFSIAVQMPDTSEPESEYVGKYLKALFRETDENTLRVYWGSESDFANELAKRWRIHDGAS